MLKHAGHRLKHVKNVKSCVLQCSKLIRINNAYNMLKHASNMLNCAYNMTSNMLETSSIMYATATGKTCWNHAKSCLLKPAGNM